MSIASALTALNGDIEAARDAIEAKGGTVTTGGGSSQLATDIASIPSGGGEGILFSDVGDDGKPRTIEFRVSFGEINISRLVPNNYDRSAFEQVTKIIIPEGVTSFGNDVFYNGGFPTRLKRINSDVDGEAIFPESFTTFKQYVFKDNTSMNKIIFKAKSGCTFNYDFIGGWGIEEIRIPSGSILNIRAFEGTKSLKNVYFNGVCTFHADAFGGNDAYMDFYCPWSEGDVAGAPWGATNATIHYNYTPEV